MNAKVIGVCFSGNRQIREPKRHAHLKYPDHYQNIGSAADSLEQIRDLIKFEDSQDPGVPMDLILVNSDAGFKEGNDWLNSLDGTKNKWGTIRVLNRENVGWSFGGFNEAFQKLREGYNYWLFTEEDIFVGGKDYYKKLIEKYESVPNTGFVALVKVCDHSWGVHAGGGVGLTSREVLDKVVKEKGCLPHYKGMSTVENQDITEVRQRVIVEGEVGFTNAIHQLGYKLIEYGECKEWNLEKNLCVPYYNLKYGI